MRRALQGRVALVTGAGRRVGREIALGLAQDGAAIAVHFNGATAGAKETVKMIEALGGRAAAFRANLTEEGEPARLVHEVIAEFRRLDILVNSAASLRRTSLNRVRERDWDEVMALNLRAPFFCCVAAAEELKKRRGCIVNISDHMGFEPWPDFLPHSISKAAIASMTHALAAALAPKVRVNAVAPGFVLAPAGYSAKKMRAFAKETPLKRLGSPQDVAGAVRFLVTAPYVTGQVLFVDGGRRGAR